MFKSIKIKNIGPIKDMELSGLDQMASPVLLLGENRVGKSHLLDCAAFVLAGEFPSKSGNVYNRVTWGENVGGVTAVITIGGREYTIERTISINPQKNQCKIWLDGEVIAGPLVSQAQAFINENIVSTNMLLMTNFSAQFKKGDFSNIDASKRKETLSDMLGLRFSEFLPTLQSHRRKLETNLMVTKGKLETVELSPDNGEDTDVSAIVYAIETLEGKLKEWEGENEKNAQSMGKIRTATEMFNSLNQRAHEIKRTLDAAANYRSQGFPPPESIQPSIAATLQQLEQIKGEVASRDARIKAIDRQIWSIEQAYSQDVDRAKLLDTVPCGTQFPSCKFISLSHEAKERLSAGSLESAVAPLKAERDQLTQGADGSLQTQISSLTDTLSSLRSAQSVLSNNPEIGNETALMAEYNELLPKVGQNVRDRITLETEKVNERIRETQGYLSLIQRQIAEMREKKGRAEAALAERVRKEQLLTQLQESLKSDSEEFEIADMLVEGFGVRGAQPLILELSIPEICEIANDLLSGVSSGELTVNLNTVKKAKTTKNEQETMSIEVTSADGRTGDLTEFSGAEQLMVCTALRCALTIFNNRKNGGLDFFFGDEMFGAYDSQRNALAMDMFARLSEVIPQVFLISHQAETFGRASTVIHLTSQDGNVVADISS